MELEPKDRDHWGTPRTACYRVGDLPWAKEALERALCVGASGAGQEEFFLSMVYTALGERSQSRALFAWAVGQMENPKPDYAQLARIRAEAQMMVLGFFSP
jgi:hypothetical protein